MRKFTRANSFIPSYSTVSEVLAWKTTAQGDGLTDTQVQDIYQCTSNIIVSHAQFDVHHIVKKSISLHFKFNTIEELKATPN